MIARLSLTSLFQLGQSQSVKQQEASKDNEKCVKWRHLYAKGLSRCRIRTTTRIIQCFEGKRQRCIRSHDPRTEDRGGSATLFVELGTSVESAEYGISG